MKLSTKGLYGLMAMHCLAQNKSDEPLSLKEIAETEHLSQTYLEHLFSLLKKEGLVESIRGAGGGYKLTKPPEEIPIGSIIDACEGKLTLSCCSSHSRPDCYKGDDCATKIVLDKLQNRINRAMDSITLADM